MPGVVCFRQEPPRSRSTVRGRGSLAPSLKERANRQSIAKSQGIRTAEFNAISSQVTRDYGFCKTPSMFQCFKVLQNGRDFHLGDNTNADSRNYFSERMCRKFAEFRRQMKKDRPKTGTIYFLQIVMTETQEAIKIGRTARRRSRSRRAGAPR